MFFGPRDAIAVRRLEIPGALAARRSGKRHLKGTPATKEMR